MDVLNNLGINDALGVVANVALPPVAILLLLFIAFSVFSIASIIVEFFVERRTYEHATPALIARVSKSTTPELVDALQESAIPVREKKAMLALVEFSDCSDDTLADIAKRQVGDLSLFYQKRVERTDIVAKLAPMLGLVGTLVPLGPGIVALGQGDTATLASSLTIAFNTTVAGLLSAAVCYVVSRLRTRWYTDYMVTVEAIANAILDRAQELRTPLPSSEDTTPGTTKGCDDAA